MAAHQERHQVLRRLSVRARHPLLLQVRLHHVGHHMWGDVLLLLLLLAHRQVRRPKLSARPAMLWPEAWPAPAHTAHTAVDTTADQPALRHSQQLGLVRRPQVEIDVVGAETTHRIEPLWAGRAAQRLIPAEAACTPAHPALMEGVVHLLRGRGSV